MVTYPDLTPYDYFCHRKPEDLQALNVGWLSRDFPFT
jgi:hypothetical protein